MEEEEEGLVSADRNSRPSQPGQLQSPSSLLSLPRWTYSKEEVTPEYLTGESESKGRREFGNMLSR